jgi:hypothetical protein
VGAVLNTTAGPWLYRNHNMATAAQNPLSSPLPDFTATRRWPGRADSTSSCLLHSFTPSASRAKSKGDTGGPALSPGRGTACRVLTSSSAIPYHSWPRYSSPGLESSAGLTESGPVPDLESSEAAVAGLNRNPHSWQRKTSLSWGDFLPSWSSLKE